MINLGKLIVMVGLPASGKSTKAKELAEKYNATILSSDEIRKELFENENIQSDNNLVFNTLNERAKELLKNGVNIVYDATNINRKKRVHLINHELKASEYICCFITEDIKTCFKQNQKRDRVVPKDIILKMYKNLEFPFLKEGWSQIMYNFSETWSYDYQERFNGLTKITSFEQYEDFVLDIDYDFENMINFAQDSSYHSFSLMRHSYYVYDYILKNYKGNNLKEMLIASIYHDLGKIETKSFINHKGEETRYAHYYGHENVSSQLAFQQMMRYGFNIDFIIKVVKLIQFHMKIKNMSEKTEKQLKEYLGDELFSDLLFFNEADNQAK